MARRSRRYYPRFRHRRGGVKKIPIAPLVGLISTPAIQRTIPYITSGNWGGAMQTIRGLVGVNDNNTFDMGLLFQNVLPLAAGMITHMIANKTGLNRAIQKVPIFNI